MMKRVLLNNFLIRRMKRSQRGQSILLLAFAFIALVAFVGLVTDVALLFVRFSSLRRAVDAAAIAAAGQIREGTNYAEVAVAAQQYIELHGLQADSILVETCETDIYQWREGLGPWEGDPHSESLFPKPVSDHMPETELCNWSDPHKLVRVSAQIISPTTFLSLIGWEAITLEATSVSETAVLDVALVIDSSESMSQETTASDYYDVYPAGVDLRPECQTTDANQPKEAWGGCCNDPGVGLVSDGDVLYDGGGNVLDNGIIWHDVDGDGYFDPGSEEGLANNVRRSDLTGYTTDSLNPDNFNFTTLICQPFKQVKDASRLFIKQLDFVRGDRVVLVTFDRSARSYDPDGPQQVDGTGKLRPLIRNESTAINTLNEKIGIQINNEGYFNACRRMNDALASSDPQNRPFAYESIASCGNTNIGGGILAGNDALTNPDDIRREAVWVMIVLSDGAANVTNASDPELSEPTQYGYWGYCPWYTFCYLDSDNPYHWPECTENNGSIVEYDPMTPVCNDNDPNSRHFCLDWETGEPEVGNVACTAAGHYDADDYARDMADYAGLVEVQENVPGNFIAMYSIAFGEEAAGSTAAALMRYVADAGDNGFIDNNLQQDLREDRNPTPNGNPADYGLPDACENVADPKEQCGQYYYAEDVASLTDVFEDIASRLFTRLSR